jgi:uncharacterized coiled-coil protein SlyX
MNQLTPNEVQINRLTKKLNKMRDQRDKARADLEHYRKVISMQPYLENRFKSYEARVAEMKRVKDLEDRVKEQSILIDALKELNWKVEGIKTRVVQLEIPPMDPYAPPYKVTC